jgi:hypothetical protein
MRRATLSVLADHAALAAVRATRCTALLISADISSGAAVLITVSADLRRRAATFSRARLSQRTVTRHHALVTIVIDAELLTLPPKELAGLAVLLTAMDVDTLFEAIILVACLRVGCASLPTDVRASRRTRYGSRSLEGEEAFCRTGIVVRFASSSHGVVVSLGWVERRLSGESWDSHCCRIERGGRRDTQYCWREVTPFMPDQETVAVPFVLSIPVTLTW